MRSKGGDDAVAAIQVACAAVEKGWSRRKFEKISGDLFDFILSLDRPTPEQIEAAFSKVQEPVR